jgi:hypothetical protein
MSKNKIQPNCSAATADNSTMYNWNVPHSEAVPEKLGRRSGKSLWGAWWARWLHSACYARRLGRRFCSTRGRPIPRYDTAGPQHGTLMTRSVNSMLVVRSTCGFPLATYCYPVADMVYRCRVDRLMPLGVSVRDPRTHRRGRPVLR